jgi:hypothetical protein
MLRASKELRKKRTIPASACILPITDQEERLTFHLALTIGRSGRELMELVQE